MRVAQTGRRTCNNPEPQHGGQNCVGEEMITRDCYENDPGEIELLQIKGINLLNNKFLSKSS